MTKNLPRWPMLLQVEGRAVRTQQMMGRLGVDALELVRLDRGQAYRRVHEVCLQCRSAETCRHWLLSAEDELGQPEFCPNLTTLLSCVPSNGKEKNENEK